MSTFYSTLTGHSYARADPTHVPSDPISLSFVTSVFGDTVRNHDYYDPTDDARLHQSNNTTFICLVLVIDLDLMLFAARYPFVTRTWLRLLGDRIGDCMACLVCGLLEYPQLVLDPLFGNARLACAATAFAQNVRQDIALRSIAGVE